MSDERAQYDGHELDEIVAEGVTVHIENMDAHHWMIRVYRDAQMDGADLIPAVDIHLSGSDLFEVEDITGLPLILRDPIDWCHVWQDRQGREHKCYERPHAAGSRHKCSCGVTTKGTP